MTVYAIGDVQGCYKSLRCLLKEIRFKPEQDKLWLAGDLVNRGPDSLKTLRFLTDMEDSVISVLGNHDLHLLAVAHGQQPLRRKDTFSDVLNAKDVDHLIDWLLRQPLVHHDKTLGYAMVHAGIPPQWSLKKTCRLAREVENILQGEKANAYFSSMYGDLPDCWNDNLEGYERLRLITNYLTRMRFIYADGRLDLRNKQSPDKALPGTIPWFAHPQRKTRKKKLIFGHWASLLGDISQPNLFALDTGCVWGGKLTAMSLTTGKRTSCNCTAAD